MIKKLGDFKAQDATGLSHIILIYRQECWRPQPRDPDDAPLILTTDKGESVHRVAKGQYVIERNPWVPLTSNDPEAP